MNIYVFFKMQIDVDRKLKLQAFHKRKQEYISRDTTSAVLLISIYSVYHMLYLHYHHD